MFRHKFSEMSNNFDPYHFRLLTEVFLNAVQQGRWLWKSGLDDSAWASSKQTFEKLVILQINISHYFSFLPQRSIAKKMFIYDRQKEWNFILTLFCNAYAGKALSLKK